MSQVFLKIGLFVAAIPLLTTFTGCESLVKRPEFEIFQSATDRRLSSMSSDLNITQGATNENRQAIEILQEQVQKLSEHVGGIGQNLDSKTISLETTFNKKLKTMMEELVKENERLLQKINESRGTTSSPSDSSPSVSSEGSVNVYNKTETPEHDLNTGFYHIVESGESLSKIAKRYQVPIDDITKANGMDNPDSLYMGQKIFIPSPISSSEENVQNEFQETTSSITH
jgi:LysM repeat protein